MKKTSSIVFFTTSLDSGGLENYLLRFLEHKASAFNQVVVFCKGGKGGQLESKYLSIPNVEIHVKKISFFNPLDYLYIYQFLKKNRVDIVCDFTGNFAGLVLFTANKRGIKKRVAFYRGSDNHFQESKLRLMYDKFVKNLVYKNATNILSNSKTALNFFYPNKWENNSRFEVIYNGINSKPFIEEKENLRKALNIPEQAFVVGHTGRYNVAKNHNTIVQVAISLCRGYNDIYFLMCGNGVKDNLQTVIENENLTDKIILSNNRSDIPKFLNTLDCFYFPSISEGQPNALLEAMLMGLPFVASYIEPILETVPEKYHSLLVPPKDGLSAIKKIESIMNDDCDIKFENLQSEIADRFNAEKLFNEFYQVLQ